MNHQHTSPHLPPHVCSVETHRKWAILRSVIFIIFFAALTGITASLVAYAWIIPLYNQQYLLTGNQSFLSYNTSITLPPNPIMAQQVRHRLVDMYDRSAFVGSSWYGNAAHIGRAALLSSDGWAVLYAPQFSVAQNMLVAQDSQGVMHNVEKVVPDPAHGLVYFKISGNDFRVVGFSSWRDMQRGSQLWNVHKDWQAAYVFSQQSTTKGSYSPWEEFSRFTFDRAFQKATMVMNDRGELAGFVDDKGLLVPSWIVEQQLPFLLSSDNLVNLRLDWKGQMVEGFVKDNVAQTQKGFYISESHMKSSATQVGKGDVVVAVNGQQFDEHSLAFILNSAGNSFAATVLRDGEKVDVLVEVQ